MRLFGAYLIGFALVFVAGMIVHDVLVFSEVRDRINRTIADLTLSERAPSAAVRQALELDAQNLYWEEAFDLYRHESASREWEHFHSNKILATPIWMFELLIWYDRPSVEALRLRTACCDLVSKRGADGVAVAAYGRGLNDLSPEELDCVAKLGRFGGGSRHRLCGAIVRLLPKERSMSPP